MKNKDCDGDSGPATCTEEVTILFQDHGKAHGYSCNLSFHKFFFSKVISVRHSESTNSLLASLDGSVIENFPLHLPWVRIEKLAEDRVSVLLMAIQVIIIFDYYERNAHNHDS